jgi:long-subunit acyl-CoA synthetase (AMP-forming)
MTEYFTSGTTGKPKIVSFDDKKMEARVAATSDATDGTGFTALNSIYVDFSPTSMMGVRYLRYGEKKGVRVVFPGLGSIGATIDMIKNDKIEGIY